MLCPSCDVFAVKRLELVCEYCRLVGPVPIQRIVPVVMAKIEQNRKEAA